MSIADKLSEIASDLPRVFEAGEKKHKMRYVTALVTGDGTSVITWDCPFEPDCFFVAVHGAEAVSSQQAALYMIFDRRSFAQYGGMYRVQRNGATSTGTMASATGGKYFRWADGVCTVEVPAPLNAPYISGVQYICTAVKFTDKSDKELLEEEILLLADTGAAVKFSKERINATVTEEEWQTLIAQKPGRDFILG